MAKISTPKKVRSPYPTFTHIPTFIERLSYRSYNWIENRLWPCRPIPLIGTAVSATAIQLKMSGNVSFENFQLQNLLENFPQILKYFEISMSGMIGSIIIFRQFLKYFYFGYKGYLFENPKKPSFKTKLWGLTRQILLKIAPPKLSSCDRLLPNLPLPSLQQTVQRYLDSLKPLLSNEEFSKITSVADAFLKNEGRSLQRYAWIWHKLTDNYVTPLWEKFIYNAGRYPIVINSSVAQCCLYGGGGLTQICQAARLLYIETLANLSVDSQQYMVVGDGLMSTRHYKNMYNGCRIPGKDYDYFEWHRPSKHAMVVHQGTWYKIDVCDQNRKIYSFEQFVKIVAELVSRDDKAEGLLAKISSLTTDGRTQWHENRKKFFLENEQNRKLLEIIETSQFVVSIEDNLGWGVDSPAQLSSYMKDVLAGDGVNRWADKTMNFTVDRKSGRGGATGEHSPCDAAELDHLYENFVLTDTIIMGNPTEDRQLEMARISDADRCSLKFAEKLEFQIVEGMESEIERCFNSHQKAADDLHVSSYAFLDFGKGIIKKCGLSPDGFVQMAIQLAYFIEHGRFVLTYEPISVRFYANSRTETHRPVTMESCEFVRSMLDPKKSREEQEKLLRKACEVHVRRCKEGLLGRGFDRHLFVLCVISKMFGYSSEFLDFYSSQRWILSTSNTPNMTNAVDEDFSKDWIMLGGSFGAVDKDGYGVCYRFAGNRGIMLHITSYHSSPHTDSDRLSSRIQEAFHSMKNLIEK